MTGSNSAEMLRSCVERIERLNVEIDEHKLVQTSKDRIVVTGDALRVGIANPLHFGQIDVTHEILAKVALQRLATLLADGQDLHRLAGSQQFLRLQTGQTRMGGSTVSLSGGSTAFHNWNPTGLSTSTFLVVNANSTSVVITGISGGTFGRVLYLCQNAASEIVTLSNQDVNSSADCRFLCPGTPSGASTSLTNGAVRMLIYDGSRWRVHGLS